MILVDQKIRQIPILEQQFYWLDGQTCQLSRDRNLPVKPEEKVDDDNRNKSV